MKVNHEMGHIQYYLQYKNLSYFYRTGANPGELLIVTFKKLKSQVLCCT